MRRDPTGGPGDGAKDAPSPRTCSSGVGRGAGLLVRGGGGDGQDALKAVRIVLQRSDLDQSSRDLVLRSLERRPDLAVVALDWLRAAACSPAGWGGMSRHLADASPYARNTPLEILMSGPEALPSLRLREVANAYDRCVIEEARAWTG